MPRLRLVPSALVSTLIGLGLGGCAAAPAPEAAFDLPRDRYDMALDAARQVILDHGLTVERVDAAAGVVSSAPAQSAGLFTPWDRTQSGLADEIEDAARPHFRSVRVSFVPAEAPGDPAIGTPGSSFAPPVDVRLGDGPLKVVVQAFLYSRQRPNLRLETESIRRSRRFNDPALVARGMQPSHLEPEREDPEFARRLTADLQRRLAVR